MKIYNILQVDFSHSIIEPLPCPIERLGNNIRYHILIKIKPEDLKLSLVKLQKIQDQKETLLNKSVKLLIDIDSISVL